MKLSAQEEYGLRCLVRMGFSGYGGTLTIPEISRTEGLSEAYVAKLMRVLRRGGLVTSVRGQAGGYTLARQPQRINIGEALTVLGGRFFEGEFCNDHAGAAHVCTHSIDCSIRSLWRTVQSVVDQVLAKTTLQDMLCSEEQMTTWVNGLVTVVLDPTRIGLN